MVAKRALANIISTDLPSKVSKFEGFIYKVWQIGKGTLSGGRITAPVGVLVVAWTKGSGLRQFVLDSIESTGDRVTSDKHLPHTRTPASGSYKYSFGVPFAAIREPDALLLPDPSLPMVSSVSHASPADITSPIPVCLPLSGEHCVISASWVSSLNSIFQWRSVKAVTHCHSSGTKDGRMPSMATSALVGAGAGAAPFRYIPTFSLPGYYEWVEWKVGVGYVFTQGGPADRQQILAFYIGCDVRENIVYSTRIITGDFFQSLVNADTWAKFLSNSSLQSGVVTTQYAAHWSRANNNLHGVCLLGLGMTLCSASAEVCQDRYEDPLNASVPQPYYKYRASLCFFDFINGGSVVAGDVLYPLAQSLIDNELVFYRPTSITHYGANPTDEPNRYGLAIYVFSLLFGYPSDTYFQQGARDTVTFASHTGEVFSWLRCTDPGAEQTDVGAAYDGERHGGFLFQPNIGFSRVSLIMPSAVLLDVNLRPEILLMSGVTYYCAATNYNSEIKHLYVGSPFLGWSEVTPPVGHTLVAVKAIQAGTATTCAFVGVGKSSDVERPYRVFLKLPGKEWKPLSKLNVGLLDNSARFDVTLFGDDPLVQSLMSMRQFPVAREAAEPRHR
jgi:hypothetical protein